MTSRRQCPRGGGGACEIPPPSGNPVSAPVICVIFWAINPSAPLTKAFPYAYDEHQLYVLAQSGVCVCSSQCYYIVGGRELAKLLIMDRWAWKKNRGRSSIMSCVPVDQIWNGGRIGAPENK